MFDDDNDYFWPHNYLSPRKYHAAVTGGPHIPNKEEAKELRRLQQKSGLTEAELRQQKVYRIKLANARNISTQGTGENARRLEMRKLRKAAALELGTHINDPRVNGIAEVKFTDNWRRLGSWYFLHRKRYRK
jgi:hypothetical protein